MLQRVTERIAFFLVKKEVAANEKDGNAYTDDIYCADMVLFLFNRGLEMYRI